MWNLTPEHPAIREMIERRSNGRLDYLAGVAAFLSDPQTELVPESPDGYAAGWMDAHDMRSYLLDLCADALSEEGGIPAYKPGVTYCGRIAEIRFLPLSVIERQEMDFRPEVTTVSDEVARSMDYSEPVEVTAHRYGRTNDEARPAVTLRDGHHRFAAALQTGRPYLAVQVKAINAKGEKLNALIALSREIERATERNNVPLPEARGSAGRPSLH